MDIVSSIINMFKTPEEIRQARAANIYTQAYADCVINDLQQALNKVMHNSGDHILERVLYHVNRATNAGLSGRYIIQVEGSPIELTFSNEGFLSGIKIIKDLPFIE